MRREFFKKKKEGNFKYIMNFSKKEKIFWNLKRKFFSQYILGVIFEIQETTCLQAC